MSRAVFNFSPGPALIPEPVLRQAADELLDWRGTGTSIMEMSHRGKEFMGVHAEAIADLRTLLDIPSNYRVLFMQGGALAENAIVPLNLMGRTGQADYLVTGQWSVRSMKEASRYGQANVVADAADAQGAYRSIPPQSAWRCSPQAAYLHVCTNETIDGVEFHHDIEVGTGPGEVPADVPIVSDVSSHILSRPMDVSRFGMLYGGAQKNVGPAGLTLVIIREDLLGYAHALCPSAFNYKVVAENDSMFNTPPTFGIYLAGLVFKWILAQGGLPAMARINAEKAALLYGAIDSSGLYENRVDRPHRSFMNVPFFLRDERLNEPFLEQARQAGLVALKGHRVVGGMRASIYNAMPLEGVQALVQFMREFERTRG
ncbi:MAG: 3-phosphoserine/phosphohydroxythreonine transaminase [Pseudomonadota bacterium]|jgi:phosphoserine aminotransferase